MAAHLAEPLIAPHLLRPDIPDDLKEVVLRCLAKEPDQRYADIADVEDVLACCECADSWSGERAAVWWRDRKRNGAQPGGPFVWSTLDALFEKIAYVHDI
jgi:eukaryotic-like serine/threonine-protein kinase